MFIKVYNSLSGNPHGFCARREAKWVMCRLEHLSGIYITRFTYICCRRAEAGFTLGPRWRKLQQLSFMYLSIVNPNSNRSEAIILDNYPTDVYCLLR